MKELLKVSIIVPVYNAENYLDICINSIINQSYHNLEILIIDDGSNDRSLDICKNYEKKDCRIKLLHHDNHGLVYTRYVGMSVAAGDYITFVDADDYIELSTVKSIINQMENSKPDVIAFGLVEEYENVVKEKMNKYQDGIYRRDRLLKEVFPSMLSYGNFFDFGILPNLVCKWINKSFLQQAHLNVSEMITVGEDADFSFQLIAQANTVQFLNVCPYHYCKREGTMMWREIKDTSIDLLYKDLISTFEILGLKTLLGRQLSEYITFVRLLKNPIRVDVLRKFFESSPKKIALYGSGGFGQAVYEQFKSYISMWVDRDYERYMNMGIWVQSPNNLKEREKDFDIIFIAVLNVDTCEIIKKDLIEMGIKKEIRYYTFNGD